MRIRWLLTLITLFFGSSCLAFSIVAVTPSRSPWLEVKIEAEKRVTTKPLSPTLNKVLLKKWLAKVRARPGIVDAMDLDLLREDWSEGVDIPVLRDILKKAYVAAPQLRASYAAKRLDAFLFLQAGDVRSARDSLAAISTWCEKPNSGGEGFDSYYHCSPMLLSWIVSGKIALDPDTIPERIELQEQTFDCTTTGHDVPDLLEFDLVDDPQSADAVARLGMRYIWDALLQGCSLKYSGAALRPLAPRHAALTAASNLALQRLEHSTDTGDFEFLQDRLPWPKNECDYARSPDCALHREFSAQQKRYVLQRISALASELSLTAEQYEQRQRKAALLLTAANAQLRHHDVDAARSSFAQALRADWTADSDFTIRLIDALLQRAAAPAEVNPRPLKSSWTYEFKWFDEQAFEKNRLIYEALLPPNEFLKLRRMQAWERVLASASHIVNEEATTRPAGPLLQLHGSWHGDYFQVEDLQLPWPTKFDWFLASHSKPLPEHERVRLFARMQLIVDE